MVMTGDGTKLAGADGGFLPFSGCGCCGSPWMTANDKETASADAHLIAAAPDLLAALKIAANIIGHPDDNVSKLIAEVIKQAEAA